jgi:hypothetical protein
MDAFVTLLIRILGVLFIVGVCGSVVVWILTAVDLISVVAGGNGGSPEEPPSGESNSA